MPRNLAPVSEKGSGARAQDNKPLFVCCCTPPPGTPNTGPSDKGCRIPTTSWGYIKTKRRGKTAEVRFTRLPTLPLWGSLQWPSV